MSDNQKIKHCGHWWNVEESLELKPSADRPNLETQVLLFARCKKDNLPLYRWYGIRKDGTRTQQHRIPQREFDRDWFPRLATDVKKPKKPTLMCIYTSEHTLRSNAPADVAFAYLLDKAKTWKSLFDLPKGCV